MTQICEFVVEFVMNNQTFCIVLAAACSLSIIWGLIVTIFGGFLPGIAEGFRIDALWKPKNFYKYAVRQSGTQAGWWVILNNKYTRALNFVLMWLFYIPTCLAFGLGIILRWCWIAIKWAFKNLWHGLVRVYDAI